MNQRLKIAYKLLEALTSRPNFVIQENLIDYYAETAIKFADALIDAERNTRKPDDKTLT